MVLDAFDDSERAGLRCAIDIGRGGQAADQGGFGVADNDTENAVRLIHRGVVAGIASDDDLIQGETEFVCEEGDCLAFVRPSR
jgi:hypothetical protein